MTEPDEAEPLTPAALRAAIQRISEQVAPPMPLVLHPYDYAAVRVAEVSEEEREKRIEAQKAIADAFEVPYWIAGVEGYRPPARVRWHPRAIAARWRRRRDNVLRRLPGFTWHYRYEDHPYAYNRVERYGRWFVQVGDWRIGWGWEEEDTW